jgi:hypothetical protein
VLLWRSLFVKVQSLLASPTWTSLLPVSTARGLRSARPATLLTSALFPAALLPAPELSSVPVCCPSPSARTRRAADESPHTLTDASESKYKNDFFDFFFWVLLMLVQGTVGLVSTEGVVPACRSLDCLTIFCASPVTTENSGVFSHSLLSQSEGRHLLEIASRPRSRASPSYRALPSEKRRWQQGSQQEKGLFSFHLTREKERPFASLCRRPCF